MFSFKKVLNLLTNDKFPPIFWLTPDVRLTFRSLPSSPTNTTVESEYNKGLICISKRQAELTDWIAEYHQVQSAGKAVTWNPLSKMIVWIEGSFLDLVVGHSLSLDPTNQFWLYHSPL